MPYYHKVEIQTEWEPLPVDASIKPRTLVAKYNKLPATHPVSVILEAAGMGVE